MQRVVGLASDDVVFLTMKLLQRYNLVALRWMLGPQPRARKIDGDGEWLVEGERVTLRVQVKPWNGGYHLKLLSIDER